MDHEHHSPPTDPSTAAEDVVMADPSCSKPTSHDRPQSVEALYLPSDNPSNFAVKGWRANPNHFTSVCFSTTAVMCVSNAVVARELCL